MKRRNNETEHDRKLSKWRRPEGGKRCHLERELEFVYWKRTEMKIADCEYVRHFVNYYK